MIQANDKTVALPPLDILKIQLLNRRDEVLRAIGEQEKRRAKTGDATGAAHEVVGLIRAMYFDLEGSLVRWLQKAELEALQKSIASDNYVEVRAGFRTMNKLLDERRIIRMDLEKSYDQTDVEMENEVKGV